MNLLEFIEAYPDEASCRAKFKEYRDHVGVVCPKCGGRQDRVGRGLFFQPKRLRKPKNSRSSAVAAHKRKDPLGFGNSKTYG